MESSSAQGFLGKTPLLRSGAVSASERSELGPWDPLLGVGLVNGFSGN